MMMVRHFGDERFPILTLEKNPKADFSYVPQINRFVSYFFLEFEVQLSCLCLIIIKFDFLYFRK